MQKKFLETMFYSFFLIYFLTGLTDSYLTFPHLLPQSPKIEEIDKR